MGKTQDIYNYFNVIMSSPNASKFYYCGNGDPNKGCGKFNDPFNYKEDEEFNRQKVRNICPNCKKKFDARGLFIEKTVKNDDAQQAGQDSKRDSQE